MKRWLISRHWTGGSSEQRPWETANKQSVSYNHSTLQPEHSFLTAVRVVETQAEPVVWGVEETADLGGGWETKLCRANARAEGAAQAWNSGSAWDWLRADGHVPGEKTPQTGGNKYQKEGSGTFIKIHGLGIVCVRLPEGNVFPIYGNWVKPPEGHCLSNEAKLGWDYGFSGPPLTQPKRL